MITAKTIASARMISICLSAVAALLGAPVANANFTCTGKVEYLGLSPEGAVTVSVGFGVWYVCNQTITWTSGGQTFSPEGCRAWYAAILAAQRADTSIRLFFLSPSNTNNGPECSAIGTWVWPNPAPYHLNTY